MDILTHTVMGACAGEAFVGKKLGKKAMLLGAFANNLPDIDVFASFWTTQAGGLLAHRGFTHSLLFAVIMTPILAILFTRIYRKTGATTSDWSILFGSSFFFHLFIDLFTAYGIGLFEPFNNYRYTFNVLFVADPCYTIWLLIPAVALLVTRSKNRHRKSWVRVGVILSSGYLVYALWNKYNIDRDTKKALAEQHIPYNTYFTTPTPLNTLLWYIVAKNDSGYNIGYRSVFDHDPKIEFCFYPNNHALMSRYSANEEVKKLIRFSQGNYVISQSGDTAIFTDLRFMQIGGWDKQPAPFVFQYYLNDGFNNDLVIQRGRAQAFSGGAMRSMIRRIGGK
jgi:inner membrane protein